MNESQRKLIGLIDKIDDLHYTETYVKAENPEAEYREMLDMKMAKNRETVRQIRELLASGVDLNFTTINGHTPLIWAVTRDNVEVVELLMEYGADIRAEVRWNSPIHRAAEFGADRVVRFLVENGIDPRSKTSNGLSVLASARNSRYSRNVLPMLLDMLRKTKSERGPQPKKMKEISEDRINQYLGDPSNIKLYPESDLHPHDLEVLKGIIESVFVEEYSVSIQDLYEIIESQGAQKPELIFACIDLIKKTATIKPKNRSVKSVPREKRAHFGDLEVKGNLKIVSLLVTGNLIVHGDVSNYVGTQLFVGGNLECRNMHTEGPVIVGGNLTAQGQIKAFYNDYALDVRQTLKAEKLIIGGSHCTTAGKFDVKERQEI